MRITRIRLRDYRGITEHDVRIPATGVTVVQGGNEVGKSSLAEALDLLFDYQDSSTHKAVKAVKPVNRDVGAEIEADIEAGPYRFTYTKRFHRERATTLVVHAPRRENLTGREAHERVLAILDEAVDVPLWKALRLQQGVALDQADLSGQTSLGAALDSASAGALAGGTEASLVDLARAEYDKFFTATGRPKAEVAQLAKDEAGAVDRVDDLRRRLAELEDDVDHAASLVSRIGGLALEVDDQRSRVSAYNEQWQSVQTLLHEVAKAELAAKLATTEAENARTEVARRQALVEEVERAQRRHQEQVAEHRRHEPAVAAAVEALTGAEERAAAAVIAARSAEAVVSDRHADLQFHNDRLHLELLAERWKRVQDAERRLAELDALLDANQVDDDVLARVEDAHLAVVQARARVEGEGAVLAIEARRDLDVDGFPLSAGSVRALPVGSATTVELDGIARITVQGGREAGQSAAALADAERRLAEACAAACVADVAAAREAAAIRRDAIHHRDHLGARLREDLRDLTPDRMAKKIDRLHARIAQAVEARPELAATAVDLDGARRLAEAAEAAVSGARDLLREADDEVLRRRTELAAVRERTETSAREVELTRRQLEAVRAELEAARSHDLDGVLAGRLENAVRRMADAARALDQASAAADKARPEELRATLDNATAVLDKLTAERDGAERTHAEVRARLAVLGEQGLHDRLAEAEAELEHRARARRATERRAAAARRLYETLDRCRGEARRAYLAPLQERIEGFGRIVFGPDFAVELGDDLRIVNRTLRGVTVAFDQLSTGAREQLCVISRLACAAVVSEAGAGGPSVGGGVGGPSVGSPSVGGPSVGGDSGSGGGSGWGGVPVILDDALGWSDPRRLERLGAVLSLAAQEAQVLILTCLPERYRHVGAAHVITLD